MSFGPFFFWPVTPTVVCFSLFSTDFWQLKTSSFSFSWEHSPLWVCLFTGSPHQVREFCLHISIISHISVLNSVCFHAAVCQCVFKDPLQTSFIAYKNALLWIIQYYIYSFNPMKEYFCKLHIGPWLASRLAVILSVKVSLVLVSNKCVSVFLSGPICRTLRTSPAASTMKCIAWGASMRTTLMPTVSQNTISPPTRCRHHLSHCSWPQLGEIHLLRDFDLHWQSAHHSSPPLHPSPSHRWDRNLKACQRDFIFNDFSAAKLDCSCQFIASLTNTILSLSLTERVKRSLILRNVLPLDFYLLPDLTVNLLWF